MEPTKILDRMDIAIALANQVGDTMHFHQTMRQPDKMQFHKAMEEGVMTHENRRHWKVIPISEVPKGEKILHSLRAIRQKRCIGTGEVRECNARLNDHAGQQVHGIKYWENLPQW